MRYFELKIDLTLKSQIPFQKSLEPISKLISTAIMNSPLKSVHIMNGFKHYVFSNFVDISPDKIYKPGKNSFIFRTSREDLAMEVAKSLFGYEDKIFKIEGISSEEVSLKNVNFLVTVNPTVLSFVKDGKRWYWTINMDGDLSFVLRSLNGNLLKKYEEYFGEKPDFDDIFIEHFQIKNQKPIVCIYKGAKIFGNKFYIVPKRDKISQRLAFLAMSEGLGEKNSLGFGYCKGFGRW